jgi:GNAT superfamily N-acetyltransferase
MTQVRRPTARVARPDEWRELGRVLGAGFQDDPVWKWVCPDDRRRRDHLGAAFAQVIRQRVRSGWAWTTTEGVQGGAVWAAPGHWKARAVDGVRAVPPMLRAIGLHGLRERLEALSRLEHHHPTEPHWYLEILAADPAMRGRGVGSALLAPMIERCDTEGVPAYLESSKEENLAFYGRFGFEVRDVLQIAPSAPPMWAMWREPR